MEDAGDLWRTLQSLAARATGTVLDIDLGSVVALDGAVVSLLVAIRDELAQKGIKCTIVGASDRIRPLVHLYSGDGAPRTYPPRVREKWVAALGDAVSSALDRLHRGVEFLGQITAAVGGLLRRPKSANWRALPGLLERAGADGVPIVILLNFLIGFVMGFQSARELKLYGANVYVADVVGIAVTRELAPLMTAIIMSGRSGAAFAAELGTMRVSEEIDALRTLGFSPVSYLILPRVAALAIAAPILTMLGDVFGVVGGVAVASSLDVTPQGYFAEIRADVLPSDVWTGLVKSVAFGIAIALIGCQQGFAARGAASGVGRGTTATVVLCLFTIVIIDTVFTILFRMAGR